MEYSARPCERHNLAILDLGSNSLRMLVVRVDEDRSAGVMAHLKQMVRLGEGSFESGMLQPIPMRRTLEALEEFASRCASLGVVRHVAYATAAMRDALNGREFAEEIRKKTGFDFRIISGEEEAGLIGLGVVSAMPYLRGNRLIVDVGGGSTEIAVMRGRELLEAASLKAGAVRMAEMLPGGTGPVSDEAYGALKERVRKEASPAVERMLRHFPVEMVGSSGSAKCLMRMDEARRMPGDIDDGGWILTLDGLRKAASELCALDEASRTALPGMNPKRSSVIIPGAAVLEVIMEEAGFSSLRYSKRGLREGIMVDYLESLRKNAMAGR